MGGLRLEKALEIEGWMSLHELRWLAGEARKCKYILEVGSYLGRSCRALAENTNGYVISVDPYMGEYKNDDGTIVLDFNDSHYRTFLNNMSDLGNVIQYRGVLKDFLEFAKSQELVFFDLIFIDGDHREEAVLSDIMNATKILAPHGTLAGHDYGRPDWPGVSKVVDRIFPNAEKADTIWFQRF